MRGAFVLLTTALLLVGVADAASSRYEDRPLALGIGAASASRIEPNFTRVAATLAGRRTQVRCWSSVDWGRINGEFLATGDGTESLDYVSGFFRPDTQRIHLAPVACAGLVALRYRRARPQSGKLEGEIATGVETLAHESMHLRGFQSESTAECYAEQLVATTARKLGASAGYASRLQALSWQQIYPAHPPQYLSSECRDGGKLDLNPASHAFP